MLWGGGPATVSRRGLAGPEGGGRVADMGARAQGRKASVRREPRRGAGGKEKLCHKGNADVGKRKNDRLRVKGRTKTQRNSKIARFKDGKAPIALRWIQSRRRYAQRGHIKKSSTEKSWGNLLYRTFGRASEASRQRRITRLLEVACGVLGDSRKTSVSREGKIQELKSI